MIVRQFSTRTYQQLFVQANIDIMLRTVGMAAAVTVACALIAFPLAYYMARYASYRIKGLLYLGVMLPLWSSYLVRVYAWKLILAQEGHHHLAGERPRLGRRAAMAARPAGDRRAVAVVLVHRLVSRLRLHLAAVHDSADHDGAGARAQVGDRGVGRSRRATRA